jgi:hypothetical protein
MNDDDVDYQEYFKKNDSFAGKFSDYLGQFPESDVDKAIKIMGLDLCKTYKISSRVKDFYNPKEDDLKTALHCDLIHIIKRWGKSSPYNIKQSPKQMKDHLKKVKRSYESALCNLEKFLYQNIYDQGTLSTDFKLGYGIRQISAVNESNKTGKRLQIVSPLVIKQEYEDTLNWGEHYPYDLLENQLKDNLLSMINYLNLLIEDYQRKIKPRGKDNKGKDDNDKLIWALCHIFKKYSGKEPISWHTGTSSMNPNQVTGAIIPFLKLILPYTDYSLATTPDALQKKLMRLRGSGKYSQTW